MTTTHLVEPPRVDEQLAALLGTWTDDAGITFDVVSEGERVKLGDMIVYASGTELHAQAPIQVTCVIDVMADRTLDVIANTDEVSIRGAGIAEHYRVHDDTLEITSSRGDHVFHRVR